MENVEERRDGQEVDEMDTDTPKYLEGWPGVDNGIVIENDGSEIVIEEQPEERVLETPEKPKRPKSYSVKKGERIPGLTTGSEPVKCMVENDNPKRVGWGNTKYKNTYPQIAFNVLSGDALRTKAHLCVAFSCSKPTITNWIRTHEEFRFAVESGLAIGEQKFREKCNQNAFMPSNTVNNGLIKMLGGNVYGIKDDAPSTIIVEATKPDKTVEELMEEMGVPLPTIDSPSMYDQAPAITEAMEDVGPGLDDMENIKVSPESIKTTAIIDKPNTVTQDEEDKRLVKAEKNEKDRQKMRFIRAKGTEARDEARRQGKPEKQAQQAKTDAETAAKAEWAAKHNKGRFGRKSRAEEIQDNIARKLINRLGNVPFEVKDGKKIVNPDVAPGDENLSTATKAKLAVLEELTKRKSKVQGMGPDFNDSDIVTGVSPFGD